MDGICKAAYPVQTKQRGLVGGLPTSPWSSLQKPSSAELAFRIEGGGGGCVLPFKICSLRKLAWFREISETLTFWAILAPKHDLDVVLCCGSHVYISLKTTDSKRRLVVCVHLLKWLLYWLISGHPRIVIGSLVCFGRADWLSGCLGGLWRRSWAQFVCPRSAPLQ